MNTIPDMLPEARLDISLYAGVLKSITGRRITPGQYILRI